MSPCMQHGRVAFVPYGEEMDIVPVACIALNETKSLCKGVAWCRRGGARW
jgi:hypothetical protein